MTPRRFKWIEYEVCAQTSHRPRVISVCKVRRQKYTNWYFSMYFSYEDASKAYNGRRKRSKGHPKIRCKSTVEGTPKDPLHIAKPGNTRSIIPINIIGGSLSIMTASRATILSDQEAIYHCVSRCVRRAYLCGFDKLTGKNFDHRKGWVRNRLEFLSKVFTIEVLSYALMSTHAHMILRTRPDILEKLTKEQVAYRWLKLYPRRGRPDERSDEPSKEQIASIVNDTELIAKLRKRMGSLS